MGYVQRAFERRVRMPMADWLQEFGRHMTRKMAAAEIGYEDPASLGNWVKRNMPADFSFYKVPTMITAEQVQKALYMRAKGMRWRPISSILGVDNTVLRDTCRRASRAIQQQTESMQLATDNDAAMTEQEDS